MANLERMSPFKKIFFYLVVFLLTIAIGGFIGGSMKAKELYKLYAKRKEMRDDHQERVREIFSRFEVQANYQNMISE